MPYMRELVLSAKDGTRILIEDEVFNLVEPYRQYSSHSTEGGGILIGEYRGKDIRIVTGTIPSEFDRRSRVRFHRESPHHQLIALKTWKYSNSLRSYLGDWHTHPEDHPIPSSLDISEWKSKLPNRKMFVAIFGRKSDWYGLWNGKELIEVESQTQTDR